MRVALFVPCYVDQLRPEVGVAALDLLEEQGVAVDYPPAQGCCGQPFLNAGARDAARRLAARWVHVFAGYDFVVTPSGSCAAMLRGHLPRLVETPEAGALASRTRELCEFLVEDLGVASLPGRRAGRVALHASCHALRELRLGSPSETREPPRRDPARVLLEGLDGLELVPLSRPDECCGFGGLFAVEEEAVSCRMGLDRLGDHRAAGAEWVTSTDVSCLLHLDGLARRHGLPLRALHVAELLASREAP